MKLIKHFPLTIFLSYCFICYFFSYFESGDPETDFMNPIYNQLLHLKVLLKQESMSV